MDENKGNILVVEDEASIQMIIRTYLEAAGYQVTTAGDGREGLQMAQSERFDLVILDVNLPGMRGFEVAAQLRQTSDVYILMLTARGEEQDQVLGFNVGADDYVVKPFSPRTLVARVNAATRRFQQPGPSMATDLCFKHVCISEQRHEVWTPSEQIGLTQTEFKLLLELMRHAGMVMSREQIINRVWGPNFHGNDRVVDVYAGQVRRKLEQVTGAILIETVRGVGYKFTDERI